MPSDDYEGFEYAFVIRLVNNSKGDINIDKFASFDAKMPQFTIDFASTSVVLPGGSVPIRIEAYSYRFRYPQQVVVSITENGSGNYIKRLKLNLIPKAR